jgi:lysyl-tRNA synthetase class 2
MKMYLRIAYELHLKRLLVGGFERVYDLSSVFRNEGVDKTHNPEFAMIEIQWAYADYTDMMRLTEELFEYVARQVNNTTEIVYDGKKIDLKAPWKRMTMKEAILGFAGIDVDKKNDKELNQILNEKKILCEENAPRGIKIIHLFEELCEARLIQPTFIIDPPIESCSLAKPHRKDSQIIERVEPFINGWELGNGYSELTDPILQRKHLEEQAEKGRGGDPEAHPMDEDYVKSLEQGLPPNAGMGIGIDRMVILLTGAESIRDVILFPIMKPE